MGTVTDEANRNPVSFIRDLCARLKLQSATLCSALIFLRRCQQSTLEISDDICIACIFLACKVEENIPSIKRLLDESCKLLDPNSSPLLSTDPARLAEKQQALLDAEKSVLIHLSFQLAVVHAQPLALSFLRTLCAADPSLPEATLKTHSFSILQDFLVKSEKYTTYPPLLLAAASVSLAFKYYRYLQGKELSSVDFPGVEAKEVEQMERIISSTWEVL